jgi:hypothetical protein
MQSSESQLTFGGTCCPHFQVEEYAKQETSMNQVLRRAICLLQAQVCTGENSKTACPFFDPEDGGSMFL